MKRITHIKICFIIITSLTLFSCKKSNEENKPISYDNISQSMNNFKFNVGSYWVYENDSTQILDSIAVTSIKHDYFWKPPSAPGTGSNTKIEYYKINFHDFLNSTNFNDFIFSSLITRGGNESPTFGQPILFHKYAVGYKLYGAEVIDSNVTIDLYGVIFTGVEKTKIIYAEQSQIEFSNDTYLYFKDSIGLIKKVVDLGNGSFESWSLKRWNINL
jgi:hypothetical protein